MLFKTTLLLLLLIVDYSRSTGDYLYSGSYYYLAPSSYSSCYVDLNDNEVDCCSSSGLSVYFGSSSSNSYLWTICNSYYCLTTGGGYYYYVYESGTTYYFKSYTTGYYIYADKNNFGTCSSYNTKCTDSSFNVFSSSTYSFIDCWFNCFHKSTNITVEENGEIKQVQAGEVSNQHKSMTIDENGEVTSQNILFKVPHSSDKKVRVNEFVFGESDSLIVTPNHQVYVQRDGQKIHIQSSQVKKDTDKFYKVVNDTLELIDIQEIKTYKVPANDLVNVYTDSKTLIANGLLASSETKDDYNNLWHGAAKKVSNFPQGGKILQNVGNFVGGSLEDLFEKLKHKDANNGDFGLISRSEVESNLRTDGGQNYFMTD